MSKLKNDWFSSSSKQTSVNIQDINQSNVTVYINQHKIKIVWLIILMVCFGTWFYFMQQNIIINQEDNNGITVKNRHLETNIKGDGNNVNNGVITK